MPEERRRLDVKIRKSTKQRLQIYVIKNELKLNKLVDKIISEFLDKTEGG